jgi:N-acetylglucosaminyldiphosphoundecaprenol N-acetyl-beta-D-mannosaminyltransferase
LSCTVLGTDCFCGSADDAAALVLERVTGHAGGYACFCNVHVIVSALHDESLRDSLERAWMRFPDGAPVAWMQRRLGESSARRVAGPDLMPRIFELGVPNRLRHYLLGSTDEVLARLREQIAAGFPSVVLAGWAAPEITDGTTVSSELCAEIRAAEADVVWCALGAPKQELWMREHRSRLAPAVLLGVGAAFDFLAGAKPRAPERMQTLGLEWLHRLASEPRRLTGRYLRTNSEFVVRAARDLVGSAIH